MMAVGDKNSSFILTGGGDVLEPDSGIIGIGSGGNFALSAAKALIAIDQFDALEIVKRSMKIAAELCVYTNNNITIENL
nr:HslU--HslV peptidase proteolytic subunit [Alphaproteobacteria bacterium]